MGKAQKMPEYNLLDGSHQPNSDMSELNLVISCCNREKRASSLSVQHGHVDVKDAEKRVCHVFGAGGPALRRPRHPLSQSHLRNVMLLIQNPQWNPSDGLNHTAQGERSSSVQHDRRCTASWHESAPTADGSDQIPLFVEEGRSTGCNSAPGESSLA